MGKRGSGRSSRVHWGQFSPRADRSYVCRLSGHIEEPRCRSLGSSSQTLGNHLGDLAKLASRGMGFRWGDRATANVSGIG